MPRKSLQGRTCSVSRDGERARALQPSHRSACPACDVSRDGERAGCAAKPQISRSTLQRVPRR
ncbi:hypothetical protein D0A38_03525 [Xanthomonas campestris pv. incanae]|nr:hypothetical protein D0A38_03525 [Xanthomonas campestris pv. incanae]RFF69952.1 hypothetical protein D0A39_18740 [Xanthomonas campestris pv. campestris]